MLNAIFFKHIFSRYSPRTCAALCLLPFGITNEALPFVLSQLQPVFESMRNKAITTPRRELMLKWFKTVSKQHVAAITKQKLEKIAMNAANAPRSKAKSIRNNPVVNLAPAKVRHEKSPMVAQEPIMRTDIVPVKKDNSKGVKSPPEQQQPTIVDPSPTSSKSKKTYKNLLQAISPLEGIAEVSFANLPSSDSAIESIGVPSMVSLSDEGEQSSRHEQQENPRTEISPGGEGSSVAMKPAVDSPFLAFDGDYLVRAIHYQRQETLRKEKIEAERQRLAAIKEAAKAAARQKELDKEKARLTEAEAKRIRDNARDLRDKKRAEEELKMEAKWGKRPANTHVHQVFNLHDHLETSKYRDLDSDAMKGLTHQSHCHDSRESVNYRNDFSAHVLFEKYNTNLDFAGLPPLTAYRPISSAQQFTLPTERIDILHSAGAIANSNEHDFTLGPTGLSGVNSLRPSLSDQQAFRILDINRDEEDIDTLLLPMLRKFWTFADHPVEDE